MMISAPRTSTPLSYKPRRMPNSQATPATPPLRAPALVCLSHSISSKSSRKTAWINHNEMVPSDDCSPGPLAYHITSFPRLLVLPERVLPGIGDSFKSIAQHRCFVLCFCLKVVLHFCQVQIWGESLNGGCPLSPLKPSRLSTAVFGHCWGYRNRRISVPSSRVVSLPP